MGAWNLKVLQKGLSEMLGRPSKPKHVDLHASARRKFKKLAADHGFTYQKARDNYLEIAVTPYWPNGLITAFWDWTDALDRVQRCLTDPSLCADGTYSE